MSRKIILVFVFCLMGTSAHAGPPVRDNTYVDGTTIQADDVMDNEDAIFTYLQLGVDLLGVGSVDTAAIQDNAVTSAKIADGTITTADLSFTIAGGALLPSGAIYFMLTGSCPSGTTDISATYEGFFIQASATQGTSGGTSTHTHGVGSYTSGAAHTHTTVVPYSGWSVAGSGITNGYLLSRTDAGNNFQMNADRTVTSSSGGGSVAVSGTSASTDHTPVFISARLCQVN